MAMEMFKRLEKISFMKYWKTDRMFDRPNGITSYSNE